MKFLNFFNTSYAISCDKVYDPEHSETDTIDWKVHLCLMKHSKNLNTDKFSCWVMPIMKKEITNIKRY